MTEVYFISRPKAAKRLIGKRFGKWTVLEFSFVRAKNAYYLCRCDCGTERNVCRTPLTTGKTRCCGCETSLRTHGLANKCSEYTIWKGMRSRCAPSGNREDSHIYAGKGIRVCERWNDFSTFLADMGPRPSPNHSIDRIDSDGPYSPENCQWATHIQQSRNTNRNINVTIGDRTQCVTGWLTELGIPRSTHSSRLARGMTHAQALTAPLDTEQARRARMRKRRGGEE